MKVLVACEFSGVVRDAFTRVGHDATSCDLEPSETPGKHIQGDILGHLSDGWDLMIAHPPCTYLSAAGLHFCRRNPERVVLREAAVSFVVQLFNAPIPRIAIENPVGYLSTAWKTPSQIVRMNDFGHSDACKPTCLWLKNLPPLFATNIVCYRKHPGGKRVSEWFGKTRNPKLRSITFTGLAEAMAQQWGT